MKKMMIGTMMLSLLALGFAGTAQAEEKTEVNYNVDNRYTLMIPESIDLNSTDEIKIGTSKHNIEPTKHLSITLSKTNDSIADNGTISLERQNDSQTHTLSTKLTKENDPTVLKKGDLLVSVTDKSDSGSLETFKFADLTGDEKAGQYKTTINFVADVVTGM